MVEGNRVNGDTSGTNAYGLFFGSSPNVLAVGNRITTADFGITFSSSTGKFMDNLTSGVTTPFSRGTAVGTNN